METTIITILLAVIALELYFILSRLQHIHGLLGRIWDGLFNDGLGKLDYLQSIRDQLEEIHEKINEIGKEATEKITDISDTADIIKDEMINKD